MPDISLCTNQECQLRNDCHRWLAEPHPYWQSYAIFNPELDTEDGKWYCDWRISTVEEQEKVVDI